MFRKQMTRMNWIASGRMQDAHQQRVLVDDVGKNVSENLVVVLSNYCNTFANKLTIPSSESTNQMQQFITGLSFVV